MSEYRIENQSTREGFPREIFEESLLQLFKQKFEGLAPICRDRIVDSNDDAICMYNESDPVDCRFSICPRLDTAADHLEEKAQAKNNNNDVAFWTISPKSSEEVIKDE